MQSEDTYTPTFNIGKALVRIGGAIVLIMAVYWLYGAYSKPSTPAANIAPAITATVAADPTVTFSGTMIQIGAVITQTTNAGAVVADAVPLNYRTERGYLLTDSDGDNFICESQPQSIDDLNGCKFAGTVTK